MAEAYLGLGANLGQPLTQLQQAVDALGRHPGVRVLAVSSVYRSLPWGDRQQAPYLNAVARVNTTLEPLSLLESCQHIECQLGRVRDPDRPWGPRRIDLDVLLYDDHTLNSPRLQLPHPWICQRAFVLQPLLELWPEARLPDGTELAAALNELEDRCRPVAAMKLPRS